MVVKTVSSKCTTPSKAKGEGEVNVKMYDKILSNVLFSMMQRYDVYLMYIKVVELKTAYLLAKDHFKIH